MFYPWWPIAVFHGHSHVMSVFQITGKILIDFLWSLDQFILIQMCSFENVIYAKGDTVALPLKLWGDYGPQMNNSERVKNY